MHVSSIIGKQILVAAARDAFGAFRSAQSPDAAASSRAGTY